KAHRTPAADAAAGAAAGLLLADGQARGRRRRQCGRSLEGRASVRRWRHGRCLRRGVLRRVAGGRAPPPPRRPRDSRPPPARAAFAVAAGEDDEAQRFATAARAAGVPVNVIDKPAFSDFSFGSIVNRSPLVVGISTDGAAPVFGQAIRAKLEALIPQGFARWAEAARRWRPRV